MIQLELLGHRNVSLSLSLLFLFLSQLCFENTFVNNVKDEQTTKKGGKCLGKFSSLEHEIPAVDGKELIYCPEMSLSCLKVQLQTLFISFIQPCVGTKLQKYISFVTRPPDERARRCLL